MIPLGRELATDLAPLVDGMDEAVRRAVDRARGTTGQLRAGSLGAAAGQLLLRTLKVFTVRHPDCKVTIHECQIHDAMARLHGGELDVLITAFSVSQAVAGPVLLSEARVLAVPAGSSWAAHASVSVEVLAEQPVNQLPHDMPQELRHERTPIRTPGGRSVPQGPTAATFPEVLALVASGAGVFPVGEHARRFYPRPDIAYVAFNDAAPVQWGPVWLESNVSTRLRAFVQAAADANAWQLAPGTFISVLGRERG
ncbi:LysR substrate-binding domain-containing protein [Streptomyces actinomycinicus]|uniref:LysR substrate-binding domain-containing protein n=1 Tax=Streptomyces actinomycinicus TaxID=1695166 RepID=UPI001F40E38E|nr:LysR substrate-binding domain-containing protein [Streptomyces actinomycinicus]